MNLKCNYCEKTYNSFDSFQRHQGECRERNDIINTLFKRIEGLEHKVRENTNYIQQQRRKIDIVDFLNKSDNSAVMPYSRFMRTITVSKNMLYEFLNSNVVYGLVSIVIASVKVIEVSPIRCFSRNKLKFYVFEEDKWQEVVDDYELELLVNSIQSKLLMVYEDTVREKEIAGKNIMRSYFEDKQKILCNGTPSDDICKKIKRSLYESLKEEISISY